MSGSALWVTQDAVYDLLAADSTLQTLLGGSVGSPKVYDHVGTNRTHPYAVLGDATELKDDTFSRSGKRVSFPVDVWSRYEGSKEVKQIADRIAIVLEGVALTITGYEHIRTVHDKTEAGRDADGVSRRAAVWFTVYTRQA